jgi:CRP/FNR family transcriptional regulator
MMSDIYQVSSRGALMSIDCSDETRLELLEQGEIRHFRPGELLFTEGGTAGVVLILLEGNIQLDKTTTRGRRQVMCDATPTSCGGICLMFINDPALASLRALSPGSALIIGKDAWQELARRDAALCHASWMGTASCMKHMSGLVEHLSFRKVSERIALALLENSVKDGDLIHWTQSELAAEVGTTREVVARCLAGFQTSGAVRLGRGRITVMNREKLRAELD